MDIWRVLSAMIRRWYVIIPFFVVTAAAALTIGHWVRPEYKASAVISVAPGKTTIQPRTQLQAGQLQAANPYLSLDYSANVLQYTLSSSDVERALLSAGLDGSYQVQAVPRTSFVGIDVTADDPGVAMATAHGIIDQARKILAKRQGAIVGTAPRVSVDVLEDADTVTASTSRHLQAVAGVLAVGGIVSVITTVLIDDLVLLRRRRRHREQDMATMADAEATHSSNGAVTAGIRESTGTRSGNR